MFSTNHSKNQFNTNTNTNHNFNNSVSERLIQAGIKYMARRKVLALYFKFLIGK